MNNNMRNYFEDINCKSIIGNESDNIKMIGEYIKKRIPIRKHMSILVLGCGNGSKEEYIFKEIDNINIVFIDISQTMINCIKNKFPNATAIKMDVMDASYSTIKQKFDVIYSFSVAQYFNLQRLKTMNNNLFELLNKKGIIAHLNIPDKSRRYIYRLNNVYIYKNIKYLFRKFDFIDPYSQWIAKKCFYGIKNSNVTIITPSYNWERYDVIIKKK